MEKVNESDSGASELSVASIDLVMAHQCYCERDTDCLCWVGRWCHRGFMCPAQQFSIFAYLWVSCKTDIVVIVWVKPFDCLWYRLSQVILEKGL